jgi:hypothetical protein
MQANTLDEEAVQLLAFAKDIVTVLGARRMEAEREAEKYFRASLAAAEFVYEAYSALRIAAQHPLAAQFLERSRERCDRALQQLRERVGEAMELGGIAELVLVASA